MKNIYLCGTMHADLAGPQRLRKVLNVLTPGHIAIESYPVVTEKLLQDRRDFVNIDEQKVVDVMKQKPEIFPEGSRSDTFLAVLQSFGYEIWVPLEYAQQHPRVSIVQLEDEHVVEEAMKACEERFKKMIQLVIRLSPEAAKKEADKWYDLSVLESTQMKAAQRELRCAERNRIFADKMHSLEGRILVVTGLSHIYGEEPSLRTLLQEYNPVDLRLIQADYFDRK